MLIHTFFYSAHQTQSKGRQHRSRRHRWRHRHPVRLSFREAAGKEEAADDTECVWRRRQYSFHASTCMSPCYINDVEYIKHTCSEWNCFIDRLWTTICVYMCTAGGGLDSSRSLAPPTLHLTSLSRAFLYLISGRVLLYVFSRNWGGWRFHLAEWTIDFSSMGPLARLIRHFRALSVRFLSRFVNVYCVSRYNTHLRSSWHLMHFWEDSKTNNWRKYRS